MSLQRTAGLRRPPGSGHDGGVRAAGDDEPVLVLPSTGPDPMPLTEAVQAVVGYARACRPLRFRSPGEPGGRWVLVPAYGWSRFDVATPSTTGDADVLLGEGLHGRLDREGWHDVREALDRVGPVVADLLRQADGRALWELPASELSVLEEPGSVGALLRTIHATAGAHPAHVLAAVHHRHPALVPHLTRTTRRALIPFLEEGDSGVEAVVRRELAANADAFAALESGVADVLGARPTRLRLHDVLLWLVTTLRRPHALEAGRQELAGIE